MASILFLALCCFSLIVIYTFRLGVSPMPSSKKAKDAMVRFLLQNIEGGKIYELGSGWGGLAERLAKEYPKATVLAIELSPVPYFYSRARQLLCKRTNLIILRKDFHEHDLSDAKAVICYLFPDAMKKLALKLKKEVAGPCPIITNTFSLEGWNENALIFLDDLAATRIYRYNALKNLD